MRARDEIVRVGAALEHAKADKDGISVSHPEGLDLGLVDVHARDQAVIAELMITTTSTDKSFKLTKLTVKGLPGRGFASSYVPFLSSNVVSLFT
jgi:hypothetical protein